MIFITVCRAFLFRRPIFRVPAGLFDTCNSFSFIRTAAVVRMNTSPFWNYYPFVQYNVNAVERSACTFAVVYTQQSLVTMSFSFVPYTP